MEEDALHTDADLPGVGECADECAFHRPFKVGTRIHNAGGIAAKLEKDASLPCAR